MNSDRKAVGSTLLPLLAFAWFVALVIATFYGHQYVADIVTRPVSVSAFEVTTAGPSATASGIAVGDVIVSAGQYRLRPGSVVALPSATLAGKLGRRDGRQ